MSPPDTLELELPVAATRSPSGGAVPSRPRKCPEELKPLLVLGSLVGLTCASHLLLAGTLWGALLEFAMAGVVLLLGREALCRGLEDLFIRWRAGGEGFLSLGAAAAFFYSFINLVLWAGGRLSTGHLELIAGERWIPALHFTTAAVIVLGQSLGRTLLVRFDGAIRRRLESEEARRVQPSGSGAPPADLAYPMTEIRSRLDGFAGRLVLGITVVVVTLALLLIAAGFWLRGGLDGNVILAMIAILVCFSPGAFKKAVQAARAAGVAQAAAQECFFRKSQFLDQLGRVNLVGFNKLGTLTTGCPQVTDVIPVAIGVNQDEIVYLAGILELQADHPIRDALILRSSGSSRTFPQVKGFRFLPGQGVRAVFEGHELVLGGIGYLEEIGISCQAVKPQVELLASSGKTVLVLAKDDKVLGIIALTDELRPDAGEAIALLREQGIGTAVVSRDDVQTVKAMTGSLQIDEIHAGMTQEQTAGAVRALRARGLRVAMVSGSISYAPAFAQADVGMAFGIIAEDLRKTADIWFDRPDLLAIPRILHAARETRRWTLWTLAGLLAYHLLALALAAVTVIAPPLQGAADGFLEGALRIHFPAWLGFAGALLPALVAGLACARLRRLPEAAARGAPASPSASVEKP